MRFWILALAFITGLARAGLSTVNPAIPAANAPLSSAPMRAQFLAAYTDINGLTQQNASHTAPSAPVLGQLWLNTTAAPYVLSEWDGAAWVARATLNAGTHAWGSLGLINGNAITAGTGGLTLGAGKTTVFDSNSTFSGTDGQSYTFPTTSAILARTDAANTFNGVQTSLGILRVGVAGQFTIGNVSNQGLQVVSAGGASRIDSVRYSADANAPALYFGKSRGVPAVSALAVQSGDGLGTIQWQGDDGNVAGGFTVNGTAAQIIATVDGAVSAGVVPARLTFVTATSGGALTEAMRINSAQRLLVGTTTDDGSNRVQINGSVKITGTLNATTAVQINGTSVQPPLVGTTGNIGGALTLGACNTAAITVTGATTGMAVAVAPVTYPGDGYVWDGYVSAANTVTVRECSLVVGTPTVSIFNVRVIP